MSLTNKRAGRFVCKAVDYFWPQGLWAGYDRFFTPAIPSRIGDIFLSQLRNGLEHGNSLLLMRAAMILSMTHDKDVYRKGHSGPCGRVTCRPTGEAMTAIDLLNDAIMEINGRVEFPLEYQNEPPRNPDKVTRTYTSKLSQIRSLWRRRSGS